MKVRWICVAHIWAVPPVECGEEGEGDKGAEQHTKATGHPTITTTCEELPAVLRQER